MCFFIDEKYPNVQIAKKDMICYKVLVEGKDVISSPFYNYVWKIDKEESTYLERDSHDYNVINLGFHSFSKKRAAGELSSKFGFDRDSKVKYKVFKCIIPKGSNYYYNERHKEYVSNKIIVKSEL